MLADTCKNIIEQALLQKFDFSFTIKIEQSTDMTSEEQDLVHDEGKTDKIHIQSRSNFYHINKTKNRKQL